MKVRLNEDEEIVRTIREGLRRTGGYCPELQGEVTVRQKRGPRLCAALCLPILLSFPG